MWWGQGTCCWSAARTLNFAEPQLLLWEMGTTWVHLSRGRENAGVQRLSKLRRALQLYVYVWDTEGERIRRGYLGFPITHTPPHRGPSCPCSLRSPLALAGTPDTGWLPASGVLTTLL